MLPFTVIGGYLGAGKTTLLNALLSRAAGQKIAVLVNDFGEVNIDAELIASHDGGTISLTNGCLCCDLSNGFAAAINDVLKRADALDHIVVEASGVAEPGKIAHYGQMYGLPLDGVLVVADAEQIRDRAANRYVGDTVLRQLAQADLIILNKTDLVSTDAMAEVRPWLAQHAPAPVYETSYAEVPLEILFGRSKQLASGRGRQQGHGSSSFKRGHLHDHAIRCRTWTLERNRPVRREALERLADRLGKEIFRAKGFVTFTGAPERRYLYQQVGGRWTLEDLGPDSDFETRTRLVFIGPDSSARLPQTPV